MVLSTVRDKELWSICVGSIFVGHREHASPVVTKIWVEWVLELAPPDALAAFWSTVCKSCIFVRLPNLGGADSGVSALDNESRDTTMQRQAIIITTSGESKEIKTKSWYLFARELKLDVALVCMKCQGHDVSICWRLSLKTGLCLAELCPDRLYQASARQTSFRMYLSKSSTSPGAVLDSGCLGINHR